MLDSYFIENFHTQMCHTFLWNYTFRSLERSDVFPLFEATQHPDFNAFLLWDAPSEAQKLMPQVERLMRDHRDKKAIVQSLVEKKTGTWQGLVLHKPYLKGIEMALCIHPDAWTRHAMVVAASTPLEIIHQLDPNLPIYNRVKTDNQKMQRICRRSGFEEIHQDTLVHQNGHSLVVDVFLLNKSTWKRFGAPQIY